MQVTLIDKNWGKIRNIFIQTSKRCIGYRQKHRNKDWITPRTWNMIGERRDAKKKLNEAKSLRLKERRQNEYSKIQKEVKKALRIRDALPTKSEEAANRGEQQNFYKIRNEMNGRNRPSPIYKRGMLLSTEQ